MRVWPAFLVLYFGWLAPSNVLAHAYLVKSVPAQRAVLYRAPAKIQLWFSERLEPRYSSFSVTGTDGKILDLGKPAVSDADPKQLAGPLKALEPGRYVVKYRVVSVDGHVVQDEFYFTIKP